MSSLAWEEKPELPSQEDLAMLVHSFICCPFFHQLLMSDDVLDTGDKMQKTASLPLNENLNRHKINVLSIGF